MADILHFTPSELSIATATLATIAAIAPLTYYLYPLLAPKNQPHMRTFNAFIKSYSTLRPQALTAHVTRDFTYSSLPLALNSPPLYARAFRNHMKTQFELFNSFKVRPEDDGYGAKAVHFSRATDTVVAHCRMGGEINGQGEIGRRLVESGVTEWWTEAVLFVKMSSDGRRVECLREFMHSSKAAELQMRLDVAVG